MNTDPKNKNEPQDEVIDLRGGISDMEGESTQVTIYEDGSVEVGQDYGN